jgi:hypothetical protein
MNDNGGAMVNPESQMVNGSCTSHFVSCDLVDRFSLCVRGFLLLETDSRSHTKEHENKIATRQMTF